MTGVAARLPNIDRVWALALGIVCLGIGLLAGVKPEYGLLAAGGVVFAGVVFWSLTAGFVLFTALSFLDVLSSSGSFSGTKVIGLVLFVSWLARISVRRGSDLASFLSENTTLVVGLLALLCWCLLSFAWAQSPSAALSGTGRYALNMLLLPIAFSAVSERRHVVWVIAAFVIGAVVSSAYGLIYPVSQTNTDYGRLTGLNGDANGEATVLAAAIPMLISLVGVFRQSARLKLVGLVALLILFIGLVQTLSREGLLSLAAVLVGAVIFGGRWRRQAATLLVIGVAATVGYFTVIAPLSARQRVTTADTSGRSSIWTVAWRVAEAHPVLGVGNDNFQLVEHQYINQPGTITAAIYIIDQPKLAHNTFLEQLADLGVPGLLALLWVLAAAVASAIRAARIFERLNDVQMELMTRGVLLGLIAVLTSAFFVSAQYAKYMWLLLALCPVMLAQARRAASRAGLGQRSASPAA